MAGCLRVGWDGGAAISPSVSYKAVAAQAVFWVSYS